VKDDLGLWCKCNSYIVDLEKFQMFKLVLEKAEEPEIKLPTSVGSSKMQESSFRMDWLDILAVQGTLKSLRQHLSSKASILWRSAFL